MSIDPGLEGLSLSAYVYGRLTADPTLQGLLGPGYAARVTEGPSRATLDADTDPPLITFTILEPQDVKVVGMIQVMARVEVQVRVTCRGASYGPAKPVYRRVHELLEAQANQDAGEGRLLTLHRVSGVQFPERANGIEYRHIGGLYQAHIQ